MELINQYRVYYTPADLKSMTLLVSDFIVILKSDKRFKDKLWTHVEILMEVIPSDIGLRLFFLGPSKKGS